MKRKKNTKAEPPRDAPCAAAEDQEPLCGAESHPAGETHSNAAGLEADHRLAERCVAGEVAAWEENYAQCHEPLCVSIRVMLGRTLSDPNFVDEIAARVWYALVANDGALLARYTPKRGARLITFMRAVAKDEICRHFRTEIRRREREFSALRGRPRRHVTDLGPVVRGLKEFLGTLSPREHSFCCEVLLAEPPAGLEEPRSTANIWQLTHRVYQKLLQFLGRGE
jgi:hypothetical protein